MEELHVEDVRAGKVVRRFELRRVNGGCEADPRATTSLHQLRPGELVITNGLYADNRCPAR
ncbi:MAG: hypothetical protein IT385_09020 [Deltaproteobacteria bacterium]|nr:hypothetical protein [Deltaproteobacteria bacterium]